MKKILLLQTGGTIAMDISEDGNPQLDSERGPETIYKKVPALSEVAEIEIKCPFFADSSDVGAEQWKLLIRCIRVNHDDYYGFVILHGTDTMAHTASALSFGLQNLAKPVILTGSQVPMANLRSDARRNLVNAVEIATMPVPEVAICFNDFVYRGNRTTKMSIGHFNAFASPNYPPLAKIGLNITLNQPLPKSTEPLQWYDQFSDEVFLLKIYPELSARFLQRINLTGLKVIVIEAFGSGNFPLSGKNSLQPFLERCTDEGILLVITSQASYDSVNLSKYESGRVAAELGAIGAGDMTTEATLTKIMYLLSRQLSPKELKKQIQTNIAGELTE